MTLPPESKRSNLDGLTALRADSDQAWGAIRERVLRGLRAYLRGRGRALADGDVEALAKDAVQDTLLTVRAKLDTFTNDGRFATWVHRIAVNALLGQLRQRRWNLRSPQAGSDVVPDSLNEEDVPAPERAALQRERWTRPAAHRGRADAASANHPARACLPPEAAGSFDGGARHLEGSGVQGDLVCSEVFELLPKYVDLILAAGDASRPQLGQPAEALSQVAHHILQCSECAEAYEALLEIKRSSR
jgi:DNA-directed RNA polymerase specialized sigma24 family protein